MIIGIDGYEANIPNRVGVGRYAYEITRYLSALVKNKKNISVNVYLPENPVSDMPVKTANWHYVIAGPKRLWTFIGLPLALVAGQRPDVIFSPTHYVPRFVGIPKVFSVMDLSYLEYPQMFRAKDLHQLVNWTKYSVKHATRILTISRFTRNAIIKRYGIEPEKVVVTYPGMTKISNLKSQILNIQNRYNLGQHYILSVGTLQPRKNFVRLIEAFSQARRLLVQGDSLQSMKDLELVIVGKKGWLYEEILAAPEKFKVGDSVKFLDFVPDRDLPALYQNALVFALPSLYEGFGLPVLEAMAYRVPVVVSDVSSLPEIAGKAGIYVSPHDVDSIAQGLVKAVKERGSGEGKARLELGLRQVKKFTWQAAARKTLAILEEVGKEKT